MAGEGSENAPAAPVEQLENLQLDEVTGEKVRSLVGWRWPVLAACLVLNPLYPFPGAYLR